MIGMRATHSGKAFLVWSGIKDLHALSQKSVKKQNTKCERCVSPRETQRFVSSIPLVDYAAPKYNKYHLTSTESNSPASETHPLLG
jgi:hypothetical protein